MGRLRARAPDALAMAALLAACLAAYGRLLHPDWMLADYDALVYFYPSRAYLAASLAEGRLPLWNPHHFLGVPFLANPQTAVLYPPSLVFLWLSAPHAYGVSLAAHVLLAGAGVYWWCRGVLGVGAAPALVGGLAFMLGGVLSGQYGHLNQVSTAAWLPWALLALDRALRGGSVRWLALFSLLVGVQVLGGHPQQSYMTLACAGWQALWRAWGAPWRAALLALGAAGLAVGLGLGLAAAQLLPTAELARESIRAGGLEYREAVAGSLWPWLLVRALLPGFVNDLGSTELLAYVGIVPLVLAVLAVAAAHGRAVALVVVLALAGLLLALGGASPLYPLLHAYIPGFASFRVPARWALVYTLGIAGLAALGLELVLRGFWRAAWPPKPRGLLVVGGVALVGGLLYFTGARATRELQLAWLALALAGAALVVLLALGSPTQRRAALAVLLALVAVELWLAGGDLAPRRPVPIEAYAPVRDSTLFLQSRLGDGRFLSVADESYELKEAPDLREWYAHLGPDVVTDLIVAIKRHEVLTPNVSLLYRLDAVDGYDGGLLPLRRYFELSRALVPDGNARPDGVLISRLNAVPARGWLDLLGVRAILAGRIDDLVEDGIIPYDRAIRLAVPPHGQATVARVPRRSYTHLGLLSSLVGGAQPGARVGCVLVSRAFEERCPHPLLFGRDTGAAESATPEADGLRRFEAGPRGTSQRFEYLARVPLADGPLEELTIVNDSDGTLIVRAMTLLDDRDGATTSLVLDDALERTEFFDVKVYEYAGAKPRAYLAGHAFEADDADALELLGADHPPGEIGLLAPGSGVDLPDETGQGSVRWRERRPEQHALSVDAATPSLLVQGEPFYPGWRAYVDGVERPLLRVNVLFRGVVVPPGQHEVVVRYEPASFRVGMAISLASLALLGLLLAVPRTVARRRRLSFALGPHSAEHGSAKRGAA